MMVGIVRIHVNVVGNLIKCIVYSDEQDNKGY